MPGLTILLNVFAAGTEPVWEGYEDSQMQLELPRGDVAAEGLQIEIWNKNIVLDELIGKVVVTVEDIKVIRNAIARIKSFNAIAAGKQRQEGLA